MTYYNELKDEHGSIRHQYKDFFSDWENTSPEKRDLLFQRSKVLFSGDYHQDIFPRLLTNKEHSELNSGIRQRASAILAFLEDLTNNGKKWSKVIPKNILTAIIKRHNGDIENIKSLNYSRIAFPYGPDIIRDSKGAWRIIEDSVGTLGGFGDIPHCRQVLYKLWPEWKRRIETGQIKATDPQTYFETLATHFHKKASAHGGIPLLILPAFSRESDGETRRLAQAFQKFGIESTTEESRIKTVQLNPGKLKGAYLKGKSGLQKIGAFICHYPLESLKGINIKIDLRRYEKDESYQKTLIRRLTSLVNKPLYTDFVSSGDVWCNFTPGLKFLNDKLFGMYVDELIRTFLKETPLIPGIQLRTFGNISKSEKITFNWNLWKKVRQSPDQYVIKKVDEDGGSHVWLGNRISPEIMASLGEKIKHAPEEYVVQDFEHLSVLNGKIVDLRFHAQVDPEGIILNQTAWGRANFINSDGKVNLGSTGFCSAIIVLKN